ncbi:MAG: hypothetical protein P0107_01015 [Nitrosomonas sp.]|nr:hypothetical protein [Nitrosomonas sp.]
MMRTIVRNQAIEVVEVPYDPATGQVAIDKPDQFAQEEFAAPIIPRNHFLWCARTGRCTDFDWAHDNL